MSKTFIKQDEALVKMADGWALCHSSGFHTRSWLQQEGCGRGGATLEMHGSTFNALYRKKLIKLMNNGYPTACWCLSNA